MALPKYIDMKMFKSFHTELIPYLSFGTLPEKERNELMTALKVRGLVNIKQDHRSFIYHKNFDAIFSGLPLEAIDEDDYAPKFDLDALQEHGGFRNQLFSMFPPPSFDDPNLWRNTMSLLRYIRKVCRSTNIRPHQSPYWLLEHMFQFPEVQR